MVAKAKTPDLSALLARVSEPEDTKDSTNTSTNTKTATDTAISADISTAPNTDTIFMPDDNTNTSTATTINLAPKKKPRLRQQSYYLTDASITSLAKLNKSTGHPKSDLVEMALQFFFAQDEVAALLKKK